MNGRVLSSSPRTAGFLVVVCLWVSAPVACQTRAQDEKTDRLQSQLSVPWEWRGVTETSGVVTCETTAEKSFPGFQAPFRVLRDPIEGHYFINECESGKSCPDSTQTGPQFLRSASGDRLVSTSSLSWKESSGSPEMCVYERSVLTLTVQSGVLYLREDVEVFRVSGSCLPDKFREQNVSPECKKGLQRSARPAL